MFMIAVISFPSCVKKLVVKRQASCVPRQQKLFLKVRKRISNSVNIARKGAVSRDNLEDNSMKRQRTWREKSCQCSLFEGELCMNEELVKVFLNKKNIFAVVGASRDPQKYGHQVYKDLRNAGYRVYPINPNSTEVLGDKCYQALESLPIKPDVVDIVVPPKITEKIVETCKRLGITRVWMQPGSESEKAIEFCEENSLQIVHGVCVMIERARHGVDR